MFGISGLVAEKIFGGISPEDADLRRFLARYLKKAPLALERMQILDFGAEPKIELTCTRDDGEEIRSFSPLDFLAELSSHIPNIWEQTTRYYGCYAARTRGSHNSKKQKLAPLLLNNEPVERKKPVSKYWAMWIKKIYNVDPLLCPRCGEQMKIIAFIHNSREITKITTSIGLQPWKAPPPFSNLRHAPELTIVPVFE